MRKKERKQKSEVKGSGYQAAFQTAPQKTSEGTSIEQQRTASFGNRGITHFIFSTARQGLSKIGADRPVRSLNKRLEEHRRPRTIGSGSQHVDREGDPNCRVPPSTESEAAEVALFLCAPPIPSEIFLVSFASSLVR